MYLVKGSSPFGTIFIKFMFLTKKLTQQEFLNRCNEVHRNKYNYSKSVYKGMSHKVTIICKSHGEFEQTPGSHITNKSGCPKCGFISQKEKRKKGLERFIKQSKKVHGDKYDYSEVEYINSKTNVTIICETHGKFYPRPGNHINRKSGCPKCSIIEVHEKQKNTLEKFINDSIKTHGNRYDYSKSKYIGGKEKITVICREHGSFYPTPNNHIRGTGCPKCSLIEQSERQKKTLEEFVVESKNTHGDLYEYSEVNYIDSKTTVSIRCKKHGELFFSTPNNHLRGSGCPKCKIEKQTKSLKEFIKECNKVHGELYDYSKVEYKKGDESVIIICKKHGEFLQKPKVHLGGGGCQKCSYSKGELEISKYLKENKIKFIPQHVFEDLSLERKLRCDFYLNVRNIVIEYNGEQHYKSNSFFGGEEGLKRIRESDKLKKNYCINRGITFEVIRFDEDIKIRLHEILNINQDKG